MWLSDVKLILSDRVVPKMARFSGSKTDVIAEIKSRPPWQWD